MTIHQKVAERLLAPARTELLRQLHDTRAVFAVTMQMLLAAEVVEKEMHTGLFKKWMQLEEVIQNLILDAGKEKET